MKLFGILLLVSVFIVASKCVEPEPQPTPTPEPTVGPGPSPSPEASPSPTAAQCTPYVPTLDRLQPVVHNHPEPDKYILDVTPKTNDAFFCHDHDRFPPCPLGNEGSPERLACEIGVLGTDPEDGRPGPHWARVSGTGTIGKHPNNAWLAIIHGTGEFKACDNKTPPFCGSITIP